jgi:hypothetical protein
VCPSGTTVAAGARCFHDAFVAGFDGRWRSPGRDYAIGGQALLSFMRGGPPRALRDGGVIGAGDVGPLLALTAEKGGGEHWLWYLENNFTGRTADTNDAGLLDRQNEMRVFGHLRYRTTHPWGPTLATSTGLRVFNQINLDGLPVARLVRLATEWQLRDFWSFELRLLYAPTQFDDREVGDGTALERPRRLGAELEVRSDPRRPLAVELEGTVARLLGRGVQIEAEATLRLRVLPQLDVDVSPRLTFRAGDPRFVEQQPLANDTRYLVGALTARSAGAVVRLTWTFTPRLTLQTYAQLFLATKHYTGFAAVHASGSRPVLHLAQLEPAAPPTDNPDSSDGVLNVNVLLRWEYRLGSTLFLVYSRVQRSLDDTLVRGLDPATVTSGPAASTFLVKLAYWWG